MRSQRREFFHIRRRRLWKSLPVGWRPILKASTWPGKRPTRRIGALAITREAASFSVRAGEQALGQTANTLASMGRREDRYRYQLLNERARAVAQRTALLGHAGVKHIKRLVSSYQERIGERAFRQHVKEHDCI
jgi:hypothetical protein